MEPDVIEVDRKKTDAAPALSGCCGRGQIAIVGASATPGSLGEVCS